MRELPKIIEHLFRACSQHNFSIRHDFCIIFSSISISFSLLHATFPIISRFRNTQYFRFLLGAKRVCSPNRRTLLHFNPIFMKILGPSVWTVETVQVLRFLILLQHYWFAASYQIYKKYITFSQFYFWCTFEEHSCNTFLVSLSSPVYDIIYHILSSQSDTNFSSL